MVGVRPRQDHLDHSRCPHEGRHAHRIPLTKRSIDIFKSLKDTATTAYVFTGNGKAKPLSNMAMAMQLRRIRRDTITVHGFRSTFRDWASEQTSFPHETCEHALAHRMLNKAEADYCRGDQFEKRRLLIEAWAGFCDGTGDDKFVSLRPSRFGDGEDII